MLYYQNYKNIMDQELVARLDAQDRKLDAIYVSVEKTRKYFLWTMIASIVMFVLPLLGIMIAIPWLLSTLSEAYSGLL
jgi:hypothetical protein